MLILLKFDVYFQVSGDILDLYELVPQKKRWQIRLDKGNATAVESLMVHLTDGISDQELEKLLSGMPPICTQIAQFIGDKKLFSRLNPENRHDDPFFRQLEVFDSWNRSDDHPVEIQKKLFTTKVLIIGAGGVGSMLANLLTSCGVGSLYCVDYDKVVIHNLARQNLYTPDDIGAYKVEILAKRLNQRGLSKVIPFVKKIEADTVDEVLKQCGAVHIVTGFPLPTSTGNDAALIRRILENGIPFLCVGEHDVGPLLFKSSEIDDYRKQFHERFLVQNLWENGRTLRNRLGLHPSYAPDIAIVCAIATDEIVRFLTGYAPMRTRDGVYSLSPITHEVKLFPTAKT